MSVPFSLPDLFTYLPSLLLRLSQFAVSSSSAASDPFKALNRKISSYFNSQQVMMVFMHLTTTSFSVLSGTLSVMVESFAPSVKTFTRKYSSSLSKKSCRASVLPVFFKQGI
jgi:hypothetical protein